MFMLIKNYNFFLFCFIKLKKIKNSIEPKLCLKPKLYFLKYHINPSVKISSNLTFKGKFRYIYIRFMYSYILFIKKFLIQHESIHTSLYFLLLKEPFLYNIDYILTSYFGLYKSIFRFSTLKYKKTKKN